MKLKSCSNTVVVITLVLAEAVQVSRQEYDITSDDSKSAAKNMDHDYITSCRRDAVGLHVHHPVHYS